MSQQPPAASSAPAPTRTSTVTLRRPPSSYPAAALPRRKPKGRFSSPLFRVGLPFLAFVTASSYILSRFLDDQFAQQRKQQQWTEVDKKVAATTGKGREEGRPFDLSAEYEKTMAELEVDLSSFENVRVPRPEQIAERTKQRAAVKQQTPPAEPSEPH